MASSQWRPPRARTADVARAIWKSRTVVVANVRVNDTNTLNEMRAALSQKDHGMKFVKNSIARRP